jgi:hypothetical protein
MAVELIVDAAPHLAELGQYQRARALGAPQWACRRAFDAAVLADEVVQHAHALAPSARRRARVACDVVHLALVVVEAWTDLWLMEERLPPPLAGSAQSNHAQALHSYMWWTRELANDEHLAHVHAQINVQLHTRTTHAYRRAELLAQGVAEDALDAKHFAPMSLCKRMPVTGAWFDSETREIAETQRLCERTSTPSGGRVLADLVDPNGHNTQNNQNRSEAEAARDRRLTEAIILSFQ